MEKDELKRPMALKDKLEPITAKSHTDNPDPKRAKLLNDRAEPKIRPSNTEMVDPK